MTNEFVTMIDEAIAFVEGSTIYDQLKADIEAAWAELKSIGEAQLKTVVTAIGSAALGGLATGGVAGAYAAGIAAAPAAFEAAEAAVSTATVQTLVSSVVNSVQATSAPVPSVSTGSVA